MTISYKITEKDIKEIIEKNTPDLNEEEVKDIIVNFNKKRRFLNDVVENLVNETIDYTIGLRR